MYDHKAYQKQYHKKWRDSNPEYGKNKWSGENNQKWYKEYIKTEEYRFGKFISRLKYRYNLTLEQYLEMYAAQDGKCSICGVYKLPGTELEADINDKIVVDHNNTSNKVRSLLCRQCNVGLGNFNDDYTLLLRAATYLINHNKE